MSSTALQVLTHGVLITAQEGIAAGALILQMGRLRLRGLSDLPKVTLVVTGRNCGSNPGSLASKFLPITPLGVDDGIIQNLLEMCCPIQ